MESKCLVLVANDHVRQVAIWLVVVVLILVNATSQLMADGKLRRVSQTVRKNEPDAKPNPRTSNRNQNRDDSNDDRPRDEDHSHRDDQDSNRIGRRANSTRRNSHHDDSHRHNHRSSRSSGFVYISSPPRCAAPVVIPVVSNPVLAPPPVIIEQPYPVVAPPPVYESTVIEEFEPLVTDPELLPVEAPLVQEIVIDDTAFGSDWFQMETSRFWALIGSDFDGITIGGLGLQLQAPGGLGLESSVMTIRESTDDYRDHLWIGDVNVMYEIIPRGDLRGRIGLGVNWLSDAWGAEAGFNLTAGFDLRLSERILLSTEGDLGSLGDSDYFHGRINLARRFESTELMLGVDHFNIGGAEITNLFTGVQFRF